MFLKPENQAKVEHFAATFQRADRRAIQTFLLISPWTRDDDGKVPSFTLDAIANRWPTTVEDVTDQPDLEIEIDDQVLLQVTCDAKTLAAIRKLGKYSILDVEGEATAADRAELVKHHPEIARLPVKASRETCKQMLVERFRDQGPRRQLKEATKDALRELEASNAKPPRKPRPRRRHR